MSIKLIASNDGIMDRARSSLREIERGLDKPIAVIIVALDHNGSYKIKAVSDEGAIRDFDMFGRAEAVISKQKLEYFD